MPSVHWRVSGASFPENSLKNPSIAAAARSGQARSNAAFGPVVMKSRDLYQGALSPGWARLASNLRASRRENGGSSAKTRKMVGNRGAEPQCFRRRRALAPSGRGRYCRVPGGPGVLSLPLYGDETGVGKPLRNPPCGPWKLCGTSAWRWPVRKRPRLRTGPYPSSFPSSLRSRFRNSAHGKTTARMKPTRMPRMI